MLGLGCKIYAGTDYEHGIHSLLVGLSPRLAMGGKEVNEDIPLKVEYRLV